jgi:hypothetical protein
MSCSALERSADRDPDAGSDKAGDQIADPKNTLFPLFLTVERTPKLQGIVWSSSER